MSKHVDVLIIGAGLSGIGAAAHLRRNCPQKTFAILESRSSMGGTWDLFRYPGIRSDSDMFTLGYSFKPWTSEKSIADGASILNYIKETAREYGITEQITYGMQVVRVEWNSAQAQWKVIAILKDSNEEHVFTCNFLMGCTGYYNYDAGYTPEFPGIEKFKGEVVHPQKWTDDIQYQGKRVVIIGSGATAVTLLPAMSGQAEHVTMLQRSPSYVAAVPEKDHISIGLRKVLPEKLVYKLARARNVGVQLGVYRLSKQKPQAVRRLLLMAAKRQLGRDFDMTHFSPHYNPWDERLCAVPNGDLFKALKQKKASVVTDHIDSFTEQGIRLKSGKVLQADMVVTATGLDMKIFGGVTPVVDGRAVNIGECLIYKGSLVSGLPNFSMTFGYTNSSWTLKADMIAEYCCRLINYMDKHGIPYCVPEARGDDYSDAPFLDLQSGYVARARHLLPRQGNSGPWKVIQSYLHDTAVIRFSKGSEPGLRFAKANPKKKAIAALLGPVGLKFS